MSAIGSARVSALAVALLAVAACTGGDGGDGDLDPFAAETVDPDGRPEVELPGGTAPDGLEVEDLVAGDGEPIAEGAVLTLHYVGVTWTGDEIASSWDRGQPLTYEHGEGRWVEGWTAGLSGMREGGRRRIVVPPELGYGERGAPGAAAGETLVFVVDLLEVG